MDKKLIMQILVVGAALLFITSSFRPGSIQTQETVGSENMSGYITFNGTIRTYDPLLLITSEINSSTVDEIRNMEGVNDIRTDPQGYIVDTETRDDVYPIAKELRSRNISTLAVANIATPSEMELLFGTENITIISKGAVRVATEPLIDAGEDVTVDMMGVSNNGFLIDYYSQSIRLERKELQMQAEVLDRNYKTYLYEIPWEDRNIVNATENYHRADAILFEQPLDVNQIIIKKQFYYITYIDANSAMVLPSFDNKTVVLQNFEDASIVLPPSTLTSNEKLDLPYTPEVTYSYNVSFIPDEYVISEDVIAIESDHKLEDTINVTVSAITSGNTIVSIEGVTLPS
jgi:hypothetical protein